MIHVCPMQDHEWKWAEGLWYSESILVHNWMDDPCKFWHDRREAFRSVIEGCATRLVCDEDSTPVGFVLRHPDNYIPEIFVDHSHRTYPNGKSKEIGRELLGLLKGSCPFVTASVYVLNMYAVKFYIKNDFIVRGMYVEAGTGFAKLSVQWNSTTARSNPPAMVTRREP